MTQPALPPPQPRRSRWPDLVDGVIDGGVVAFAVWTLVYEVVLARGGSLWWAGWPWLVLAAALAAGGAVTAHRLRTPDDDEEPPEPGRHRLPLTIGLVVALAVVILLRAAVGYTVLALVSAVVIVVHLAPWLRRRAHAAGRPLDVPGWQHGIAALVSLGLGALASFINHPNADDVFYVNRATWIAQHGTVLQRDTMFGPGRLASADRGGLETPSIEALQGVLAHTFGVTAPTVAYLVCVPVLSALVGWIGWRLLREWAPRRALLAFVTGVVFLLASAQSMVGRFSIDRIWQGKVIAVAVLLPLIWLCLSKLANRPRLRELALLLAAGIALVGLTTTSALVGPVVVGAALVAAAVLRSKGLLLGAVCLAVGPAGNALAQKMTSAAIGDPSVVPATPAETFVIAFGVVGVMALIGYGAAVLGVTLVRGPAAVVIGCGALATAATLLPGILDAADAVTGAGPVVWRLAITLPVWVLVGLLVTVPLPGRVVGLVVPVATAVALVVAVTLGGRWLWSSAAGVDLTARPVWKVDQQALTDVRAAERLSVPPGLWLLPPQQMEILAISKVGPFAVVPRDFYLPNVTDPAVHVDERHILYRLVHGEVVSVPRVRDALGLLDVSLACVPADDAEAVRVLIAAVGDSSLRQVGSMRCHVSRAGRRPGRAT
ncbi:hypothetical protein GCM10022237_37310 [Nocardioides ginsengisoli]|uniref:DUF6077 domain-containing protein n=1 Tax=Nocardioides ginsengisoli TaxID=363868 RepID=A0ABW3VXL0_9ACTN